MIKVAVVGVWICVVAFGSLYFATQQKAEATTNPHAATYFDGLDYVKTDPMNVPVIVDGRVQGYVISQLVYVIDSSVRAKLKVPAEYFINDEIFRLFYGAYSNTREVEKIKFDSLRKTIIDAVNKRLGEPVIKDLLVSQFSYLTADEVRNLGLKEIAPRTPAKGQDGKAGSAAETADAHKP